MKRYVGNGEVGVLASQLDAIGRNARAADREAERAARERAAALDAAVAELDELADLVARAALAAAGYRQHKRGEWRRSRGRAEDAD